MASATSQEDCTGLPVCHKNLPLDALRVSARKKLSEHLNSPKPLTENDIVPDFNGLAEKIGFTYTEIQNFTRLNDPTAGLLDEWTKRPDLHPSVGSLFEYLKKIERDDVCIDCRTIVVEDIQVYVDQMERRQDNVDPDQVNTVSQSDIPSNRPTDDYTDHSVDGDLCLTVQDVENNSSTFYDAFICYIAEGYDLQFVKKMISTLESPPHKLKLFVPFRDDLPGSSTYTVFAKIIQQRCRRMVIILSPRFLTSPACDFQIKFAQCLSPGSRSKKLIPVLIAKCEVPEILKPLNPCNLLIRDLQEWVWPRLVQAIKAPVTYISATHETDANGTKGSKKPMEYQGSQFPCSTTTITSNSINSQNMTIIPSPNQRPHFQANGLEDMSPSPRFCYHGDDSQSMPTFSVNSTQMQPTAGATPPHNIIYTRLKTPISPLRRCVSFPDLLSSK